MSESTRLSVALADRYQMERELGHGGMATVYLAQDLKHDRKVAVKVLKPELAAVLGAERFVVEIKTTASLSHPHILPLFDSGTADGFLYYVMPYIEGETLRDVLNRETQLGVDEAVRIACEVADALDYAHRHGVIHRDIKPENILMHDGRPMVADFGIALAVSAAAGGRMTETGLSLGTPHYMSPEQATAEKEISGRSDVYSLASVLYEMLTGEPPHMGNSAQQIIMKIIADTPRPVTELRKSVPAHVAAAVAQALEKLPADRFHSAAEFAGTLSGRIPVGARHAIAPHPTAAHGEALFTRRNVAIASACGAVLVAIGWTLGGGGRTTADPEPVRFTLPLQDGAGWRNGSAALAPDGSMFVRVSRDSAGRRRLVSRAFDSFGEFVLPGTADASILGFSTDSRSILIFRGSRVSRMPLAGGPQEELNSEVQSATLLPDGSLVYNHGLATGLQLLPATGGVARTLTTPDSARRELGHWGVGTLPNGRGVLFTAYAAAGKGSVEVVDTKTGRRIVVAGEGAIDPRYSTTGHILFWRRGVVFAVPFDAARLKVTGVPVPVLEDVAARPFDAIAFYWLGANGTLVYVRESESRLESRVIWMDRAGRESPAGPRTGNIESAFLSPDERMIALTIELPVRNIWLHDIARGITTPLTKADASAFGPIWSPDGRWIYYTNETPSYDVYRIATDGASAAEAVVQSPLDKYPFSVTRDGKSLLFGEGDNVGTTKLKLRALGTDTPVRRVIESPLEGRMGRLSPDDKWMVFAAAPAEGRREEVYLIATAGGARQQLSVNGGTSPRWTRGGREIVYVAGDSIVSVAVDPTSGTAQLPRLVIRDRRVMETRSWAVSNDGERFLLVLPVPRPNAQSLAVVLNWHTELKRRIAAR